MHTVVVGSATFSKRMQLPSRAKARLPEPVLALEIVSRIRKHLVHPGGVQGILRRRGTHGHPYQFFKL